MRRKTPLFAALILLLTLLTACAPAPEATASTAPDTAEQELIERFGTRCITEQTREIELDGFEGRVWFVPYSPFHSYFYVKLMQEGETLAELSSGAHEGYSGDDFRGLESVVFRELNGDGDTDIVIVGRFGDECFAEVFLSGNGYSPEERFYRDDKLGEQLRRRAEECALPLTAEWAADMLRVDEDGQTAIKSRVGEFDDWRVAYRAAAEWYRERERPIPDDPARYYPNYTPAAFALVDIDGDDTPELAVSTGHDGGRGTDMFTFRDGALYRPMCFDYTYELEYLPGQNSVRFWRNGILCSHRLYQRLDPDGEMHTADELTISWFTDPNDNGMIDEDEPVFFDLSCDANGNKYPDYEDGDELRYTCRLNGERISCEEFESYGAAGYESIDTDLSFGELMRALDEAPA